MILMIIIMILMIIIMILMIIMIILIVIMILMMMPGMKLTSIMGAMVVGEAQPVGVGVLPGEPVESIVLPGEVRLLPGELVESRTTRSIGSTITLPKLSLSIGSRMTEETVEL